VIKSSAYYPYAGATVFGSRQAEHGHGIVVSCIDELEALHSDSVRRALKRNGPL
jgi:hypothetical protein